MGCGGSRQIMRLRCAVAASRSWLSKDFRLARVGASKVQRYGWVGGWVDTWVSEDLGALAVLPGDVRVESTQKALCLKGYDPHWPARRSCLVVRLAVVRPHRLVGS